MKFRAKDIQKLIDIPKHRYEYLASKIGIPPEVEEVDGSGRSHIYSFKNLLQFAFVHHANMLGLTPRAAREMLTWIEKFEKVKKYGIFDPNETFRFSLHYVGGPWTIFIPIVESDPFDFSIRTAELPPPKMYPEWWELREGEDEHPGIIYELDNLKGWLKEINGYVTINLGSIKKRMLDQLE